MTSHLHLKLPEKSFLDKLKVKISSFPLEDKEQTFLLDMMNNYVQLATILQEKNISVRRLKNIVFGQKTEKSKKTEDFHGAEQQTHIDENSPDKPQIQDGKEGKPSRKKRSQNGRRNLKSDPNAKLVHCSLEDHDKKTPCPACSKGKLFPEKPKQKTCIRTVCFVSTEVYELESVRCRLCNHTKTAQPPTSVQECYGKYHASTIAHLSCLRYLYGMPSYRLENFMKQSGLCIPNTTQFRLFEYAVYCLSPIFRFLEVQAANGKVIYRDDSPMKIVLLKKEIERIKQAANNKNQKTRDIRKSISTTHIHVVTQDGQKISLYFTGISHSGDEYERLMQQRTLDKKIISMSDGASLNDSHQQKDKTINLACLVHSRRNFYELKDLYPDKINPILKIYSEIYKNEKFIKENELDDQERLFFHQENSSFYMKELLRLSEIGMDHHPPNSSLYKAYRYIKKHWDKLSGFLHVAGAPLDNSLAEQGIKVAIRHRKNSLFYRSAYGARVGDVLMSLLNTCTHADVNPIQYLTQIIIHHKAVKQNPERWMPWNYMQQ